MTSHTDLSIRTFADVERYLAEFTNYERMRKFAYTRDNLDLERVRRVLDSLGAPDRSAPIFHVAGTKGKGSVCAFITSILLESGFNVGLFSKPHLLSLHERLSINNQQISDEDFVIVMNDLLPHLEEQRLNDNPLTFFDIITVAALQYFGKNSVDAVVLEVGLGGRLDSTNVVEPKISVITSIDYDHTKILGETLEKIAYEKAGIIKEHTPVISGVAESSSANVIRAKAKEQRAPLIAYGSDFSFQVAGTGFDVNTPSARYKNLNSGLLGEHQMHNASVAVAAIECAAEELGFIVTEVVIRAGLSNTKLRARIQVLSENPRIILDVAHNPSSVRALRKTLKSVYPAAKVIALVGMTDDKELEKSLIELLDLSDEVIYTMTGNPTSASPEELKQISDSLKPQVFAESEPELDVALAKALQRVGSEDLLCITGSFYLAGAALKLLKGRSDLTLLD